MEEERKLVQKAKRGNTEAFAKLYSTVYEDMYRFALYVLKNTEDAKDAVSEAVLAGFSSIRNLRKEEAFRSWIFRILFFKCKEKCKEYTNKTVEYEDYMEEKFGKEENLEEQAVVRRLFFELDEEERQIISMHLFCGYKSREIADLLGMNENTVRSKESRALKKLALKWKSEEVAL